MRHGVSRAPSAESRRFAIVTRLIPNHLARKLCGLISLALILLWMASCRGASATRIPLGPGYLEVGWIPGQIRLTHVHITVPSRPPASLIADALRQEWQSRWFGMGQREPQRFIYCGLAIESGGDQLWVDLGANGGIWIEPVRWLSVAIPFPLPVWIFGLIYLRPCLRRRLIFELRSQSRQARGLCPRCGYDLRASPQRCPECGLERTPTRIPRTWK
jgi:hypothetical protein